MLMCAERNRMTVVFGDGGYNYKEYRCYYVDSLQNFYVKEQSVKAEKGILLDLSFCH